VIFLGTNDVGELFALPERDVARSVARLVKVARSAEAGPDGGAPAILVVCPPPFDGHRLGPHFAEMCSELGCALLDLDGVASYAALADDVEHLDEAAHAAVAVAVEQRVRQLCP
jgi:lysophospholipase L1-like esterase